MLLTTDYCRSIVIRHLQKTLQDENVAIAYIYCNHKEQAKQTVRELVASLLKQFVQDRPEISECATSLYDSHYPKATRPCLSELTEALRKEVEGYSKAFIVIDALDELVERDRSHLIKEVQSLSNTVHLMVTSRRLLSIEQILCGAKSKEIRADERDVRTYVNHCIRHEPRLSLLIRADDTLREHIAYKISINAKGMYVYPSPIRCTICYDIRPGSYSQNYI
jgi:hypothetical protein